MFLSTGSVTLRLGTFLDDPGRLCLSQFLFEGQGTAAHSLDRRRAEIPIYSFAKHAREIETTSIYSPHVLILEGIIALYDPRVLQLLDMKVRIRLT